MVKYQEGFGKLATVYQAEQIIDAVVSAKCKNKTSRVVNDSIRSLKTRSITVFLWRVKVHVGNQGDENTNVLAKEECVMEQFANGENQEKKSNSR